MLCLTWIYNAQTHTLHIVKPCMNMSNAVHWIKSITWLPVQTPLNCSTSLKSITRKAKGRLRAIITQLVWRPLTLKRARKCNIELKIVLLNGTSHLQRGGKRNISNTLVVTELALLISSLECHPLLLSKKINSLLVWGFPFMVRCYVIQCLSIQLSSIIGLRELLTAVSFFKKKVKGQVIFLCSDALKQWLKNITLLNLQQVLHTMWCTHK